MYLFGQTDRKPVDVPPSWLNHIWLLIPELLNGTEVALRPALMALHINVYRAGRMLSMYGTAMHAMRMYERARRLVATRKYGRPYLTQEEYCDMTTQAELWKEFFNPTGDWAIEVEDQFVPPLILSIINPDGREQDMSPIWEALVISIWTAFETFAGDLWERALNGFPQTLAELRGGATRITALLMERRKAAGLSSKQRWGRDVGAQQRETRQSSKQVPLDVIRDVTGRSYNLGSCMGTLLRTAYFDFSTLSEMRAAYSAAFCYYSTSIDDALADPAIDALNRVRNLLVHNAGNADAIYLESIGGLPAPRLKLAEKLIVDSAMARALVEPVLRRAKELVQGVSEWVGDEAAGKHASA